MKKQKPKRKLQIGVMGSTADLKYSKALEKQAEEIGYWVSKKGAVLIFGAEKDYDSLSTAACRGAKKANGLTVGITYGKGLSVYEKNIDVVIATGLERGGGREFPLVLSCDAIIALSGGSGTLTEIAIAYQANIPVIALKRTGGWSERLANQYLDDRKRVKIETANTAKEAVEKAIELVQRTKTLSKDFLFLTAVHGDEKLGVEVMKKLEKTSFSNRFDWVIANKKALKKGVRFSDRDLNRLAPGDKNSKKYEYRRAYELIKIAKNYRYVIDIHGTVTSSGIFTIVSNPKLENLLLAASLPIKNVVIWASKNWERFGPMTQFVDCGVEIECGPKNSKVIWEQLFEIVKSIVLDRVVFDTKSINSKEWFQVYGKLVKSENNKDRGKNLKDFQKVEFDKEVFYPLLVGQYDDVICYKMKKVNFFKQFAY